MTIQELIWADTHPRSRWISVYDDLPCNHKELITDDYPRKITSNVITIDKWGVIEDSYMILRSDGKWEWEYGNIPLYWMPIPKLPK